MSQLSLSEAKFVKSVLSKYGHNLNISLISHYVGKNEKINSILENFDESLINIENVPFGSVRTYDGYNKKLLEYIAKENLTGIKFYTSDDVLKKVVSSISVSLNKQQSKDYAEYTINHLKTANKGQFDCLIKFAGLNTYDFGEISLKELFFNRGDELREKGLSLLFLSRGLERSPSFFYSKDKKENHILEFFEGNVFQETIYYGTKKCTLNLDDLIKDFFHVFVSNVDETTKDGAWYQHQVRRLNQVVDYFGSNIFKISREDEDFYQNIMKLKEWKAFDSRSLEFLSSNLIVEDSEKLNLFPEDLKNVEYINIDLTVLKKIIPQILHPVFENKKPFQLLMEDCLSNSLSIEKTEVLYSASGNLINIKVSSEKPINKEDVKKVFSLLMDEIKHCTSLNEVEALKSEMLIKVFQNLLSEDKTQDNISKTSMIRKF